MTEIQCHVEWDTERDDEDGDGEAKHACFLPEGHVGEWHVCAWHLACTPICGVDSWAPEGEA